jgi:hypothetical protein
MNFIKIKDLTDIYDALEQINIADEKIKKYRFDFECYIDARDDDHEDGVLKDGDWDYQYWNTRIQKLKKQLIFWRNRKVKLEYFVIESLKEEVALETAQKEGIIDDLENTIQHRVSDTKRSISSQKSD